MIEVEEIVLWFASCMSTHRFSETPEIKLKKKCIPTEVIVLFHEFITFFFHFLFLDFESFCVVTFDVILAIRHSIVYCRKRKPRH